MLLQPEFRGADGQLTADPFVAAGSTPTVKLAGLARLFAEPVLFGEFAPSSYWSGVDLVWPAPKPLELDGTTLQDVFASTVAQLCEPTETVAVSLSGGLDSLAVLWRVLQLRPIRRVLAYTVDLVDDTGQHAENVVRRLLADLGISQRVSLVVVDPRSCKMQPTWSPTGPRLDALPSINATIAQQASEAGAGILLSGNGADELLSVPRYATTDIVQLHGWRAASRYVRDLRAGQGILGECAALSARAVSKTMRARSYWAVNWPSWCDPKVSAVLAAHWHTHAADWARRWVDKTIAEHALNGRSWAEADAYDSWWPKAFIPPTGPIPEASPFGHVDVVRAALALPLAERYDPHGVSAYLRVKGQVVHLFPNRVRHLLPTRKRYYRNALAASTSQPLAVPMAVSIGLLDEKEVGHRRARRPG